MMNTSSWKSSGPFVGPKVSPRGRYVPLTTKTAIFFAETASPCSSSPQSPSPSGTASQGSSRSSQSHLLRRFALSSVLFRAALANACGAAARLGAGAAAAPE